ncbi:MAG: hypothetical protein M3R55_09050 [Acidobacteriota bacterium]|nr:hypothetical protein [Acidobacteriota bacterium]
MKISVEEMQHRLHQEVSLPSRLAHTALLVAAAGMSGVAGSLLLTEAALPTRTRAAFAVIVLIGAAWAAFAVWVLARRKTLFGRQQIIAARMAVVFTAVFLAGSIGLRDTLGRGAIAVSALMFLIAGAWLIVAGRRVARLEARRLALRRGPS